LWTESGEPPPCGDPATPDPPPIDPSHSLQEREEKEREQQTCYCNRCHRVLEFAAMSWIWPEEKKGGRLAVHPTGGEEGRPPLQPVARILTGG